MSRCFPFPPPGYEKKSRAEDVDPLKKEKNKEKKHKKEKKEKEKEKEKREGKEKRDKEKSDEKRLEKKDKKKDRDKKKDKKKEKEKDKAHSSVEGKPLGKTESQNGDEVVKVKDNNNVQEKYVGQVDSYVGNKISQNILPKETKNSKPVQEVGRRIEDSGTGRVEKFSVSQPKRDDGMATLVDKSSDTFTDGKEQNKYKKTEDRKYNGQGIRHEERFIGNSAVPSSTTSVEAGVAGMYKFSEKTADRRMETNDKIRQKEGDEKRGSKHKDKDKEKERERKGGSVDKERDKEKKKEKKAKEKMEEKNAIADKSKEVHMDNLVGRHSKNTNTSQLPDSNKGAAVVENLIKKRKDLEPNGFLHAIDNRSSKLLKSTSHQLKENGRILEPGLSPIFPPSERHGVANDLTLGNKESKKINGIIEAHPPAISKQPSARQDDQLAAIPKKSSHPDSKYLSQVYSVPKMEEFSDSDNQEWLFCSNTSQLTKPKLKAPEDEEMPQVWAESKLIESADICALPYVIPY